MSRQTATSAAWLESIELENVRCFHERQIVPFTTSDGKKAQWTLLLGENGTGKSTLLQVCAMLMPRSWKQHSKGVSRSRSAIDDGVFLSNQVRSDDKELTEAQFSLSLRLNTKLLRRSWTFEGTDYHWKLSNHHGFDEMRVPPRIPPCLAYAPYRSAQAFIPDFHSPLGVQGLFSGFTRLRSPKEWFQDRTLAAVNPQGDKKSKKTAHTILDRVRQTLFRVLPDVTDLKLETEQEGRGANRLRAQTPYGWVDIDSLGFGYQSILALVVDIASRLVEHYPDSPNPLAEPAVILIDEVDLHLHPKWQRTLQQELSEQFPNAQFIATAHSPLVVQSSPSANVLLLKREGDHVVIERAPDVVKTWRIDQILTSDVFGLPSARPPSLDAFIAERDAILGKSELSPSDEKRLNELREEIGALPGGETPWQMEAMELISKVAKTLKSPGKETKPRVPRTTKRRA